MKFRKVEKNINDGIEHKGFMSHLVPGEADTDPEPTVQ